MDIKSIISSPFFYFLIGFLIASIFYKAYQLWLKKKSIGHSQVMGKDGSNNKIENCSNAGSDFNTEIENTKDLTNQKQDLRSKPSEKNFSGQLNETNSEQDLVKKSTSSFYAEAFVTSGPRKEQRQGEELGEDTCGFVQMGGKILFWILDGESQREYIRTKDNLEIFSSRLMAQLLTSFFPVVFSENIYTTPNEVLQESMKRLCAEWKKKSQMYNMEYFRKSSLCCTTVLLGILDSEGHLKVNRIGDSKAIIFQNRYKYLDSELSKKPDDEKNLGQFFSARLDEGNQLRLFSYEGPLEGKAVKGEEYEFDNVQTVLSYSDGVNNHIAEKLMRLNDGGISSIRETIFQMPQTFQDDKSLLLIRKMDYNSR